MAVVDHSPTALLALRGSQVRQVLFGIGFYCPPDQEPLPKVRPWAQGDEEALRQHERQLCEKVNQLLAKHQQPNLPYLARLFHDVDDNILATFPEIDHFGSRANATYWGTLPSGSDRRCAWPTAHGPRVYAYLKSFPGIEEYLGILHRTGWPVIAVADHVSEQLIQRLSGSNVRIETSPIGLGHAARECDFAITNGSHGVTAAVLLAGKPLLQIPLFVEQFLIADRVQRLGAGILIPPSNIAALEGSLSTMLQNRQFHASAAAFAAKYSSHDPESVVLRIADRLEQLIHCDPPRD